MLTEAVAGTPLDLPPTEMLSASGTFKAEMFRLPEARMPASPALRYRRARSDRRRREGPQDRGQHADAATSVEAGQVDFDVAAGWIDKTRVGGAETTVLEEAPASISPVVDQMISLPP